MQKLHYSNWPINLIVLLLCCLLTTPSTLASTSEKHEMESSHQEHNDSDNDSEKDDDDKCGPKSDDDGDTHHGKTSISHDDSHDNKHDSDADGGHKDDDKHHDKDCGGGSTFNKPLGSAHIIIDNSAAFTKNAVHTNMATTTTPTCSKVDVLDLKRCNSFSLGNNDIQVIQNDVNGNLTKMIGVNNQDSSSYENKGTDEQLDYFSPDKHLIDINSIRTVASNISNLNPDLPEGTYGTISFKQFIQNVALGRSMYGVVRVEVPLLKSTAPPPPMPPKKNKHDDDGDDGHGHSDDDKDSHHESNKTQIRSKTSSRSGSDSSHENDSHDSSDDDHHDDDSHHRPKYRLCGEDPTPQCSYCGPGDNTIIQAGETICGIPLGKNPQINVFGSLMFDWVDCNSQESINLKNLTASGPDIKLNISVPMNINPANQDVTLSAMKSMKDIVQLVGENSCPNGSPCNLPINNIPFDLIKDNYELLTNKELTNTIFSKLSQASKFHLLMPSGYANGWNKALSALNISADTWHEWGFFDTPSQNNHILTIEEIMSKNFHDIPALIYSGGIVGIHHHTNISGLVYIPQAFDLEQSGLVVDGNSFIPSLQYISGAIIVRDGFYLEAIYSGGATIISNNPYSYDKVKLDPSSGASGRFERFPEIVSSTNDSSDQSGNGTPGSDSIGNNSNGENNSENGESGSNDILPNENSLSGTNPGAQWMEVRPQ